MFPFTDIVLYSSNVKVNDEIMLLSLVRNLNKETCIFLFNRKKELVKLIPKAAISKISKDENNYSWETHGVRLVSDLNTLEIVLKSNLLFEAQDCFMIHSHGLNITVQTFKGQWF